MSFLRSILTSILCLLPSKLGIPLLNIFGHKVALDAKIGFSLILCEKLYLAKKSRIGHFNLIVIKKLLILDSGYIGPMNYCKGPFYLIFKQKASIGSRNVITRSNNNLVCKFTSFKIGVFGKLTADHRVDCMSSVSIGCNTTIAGSGTQIWTHGYYHEPKGSGRFRVDGRVVIGDNVYIGSRCVISMGVSICDSVTIGSLSSVAKSISMPGLYVSQPLRHIDSDIDLIRKRLIKVENDLLRETVYVKPIQRIEKTASNS
jgi:UDP-3-O-[3-hydroxymyristoyl] glucosamine N-acyltransferase